MRLSHENTVETADSATANLGRVGTEVVRLARVAAGMHLGGGAETALPEREMRDQAARLRALVAALQGGGK